MSAAAATHYRICPLCEACCGLQVQTEDGRVTAIRGAENDVFSAGYICPKGVALKDLHEDPDRLRTPLVRRNGKLEPASWDEAFAGCEGDPVELAAVVRRAIAETTGLPSAVGVSDNKQRAKMATGFAKKSTERVFVLDDDNWLELMGERPCIDLWSVGPRISQRLQAIGVRTVNGLIATEREALIEAFGQHHRGVRLQHPAHPTISLSSAGAVRVSCRSPMVAFQSPSSQTSRWFGVPAIITLFSSPAKVRSVPGRVMRPAATSLTFDAPE